MADTCIQPEHGTFIDGICAWCGHKADDSAAIPFEFVYEGLKLASWEIDYLRKSNTSTRLQKKKLALVLDLDHTLLHTVFDLNKDEKHLKSVAYELKGDPDTSLFLSDTMEMITKIRPFVRNFLKEASTMFQMYVYTMGNRAYARDMTRILDPEDVYFTNRVISIEDCTVQGQKGLDMVLVDESIVVILDDTRSVWERHSKNLIPMKKYFFFGSGNSARMPGGVYNESEAYCDLLRTLDILKELHRVFFCPDFDEDFSSRDVREVLKSILDDDFSQGCELPQQTCSLPVSPAQNLSFAGICN